MITVITGSTLNGEFAYTSLSSERKSKHSISIMMSLLLVVREEDVVDAD